MNKQRIEIECREDGSVKIEALGFEGNACTKATALIEKALGTVKSRAIKPEFYKTKSTVQKQAR